MSALTRLAERMLPDRYRRDRTVVPLVRLTGAIAPRRQMATTMSLATVEGALRRAFSFRGAPVVALLINSPGGSAVQSHLIHRRIRALAAEKDKKVIVGVEDVAASGGYLIATAGDEIVADESSLVGSIGVVFAGFGFPALLDKIGVERRVHTAGADKAMLDPFRPEREEDVARLKAIQGDLYETFVDLVKARRGDALADDGDLFSGAVWSGRRAHGLGLVDGIGDLRTVLTERYGTGLRFREFPTERRRVLGRLGMGAHRGAALAAEVADYVEERLMWSRYGL